MRVGFIGAGTMGGATARGLGDPVLCCDAGSGRAAQLAAELGGTVFPDNRTLARQVDAIILPIPRPRWSGSPAKSRTTPALSFHF